MMNEQTRQHHPDDLMTMEEVATYLRISIGQLSRMLNGKVPGPVPRHARAGKRVLFRKQWVDAWLEQAADWKASKTER